MTFHFIDRSDVESLFRQAGRQVELAAVSLTIQQLLSPPQDRETLGHQYLVTALAQHELIEKRAELLAQFEPPAKEDEHGLHPGT